MDIKNYRDANICDLDVVTDVHMTAFPGFFLTTLGAAFVRTMYKAFLLNPGGIFVVNEASDGVAGFAVGALKASNKDKQLAIRLLPQFIWAVIPAIILSPVRVLMRILAQFFAQGGDELNVPEGAAVLRSIGVRPEIKGRGVAGGLLNAFEQRATQMGATSVALTTDVLDNERAIKFYRKHGYEVLQKFTQGKQRPMFLMLKELP